MKVIRYLQSWFAVVAAGHSEEKFKAGQCYPISEESRAHVDRGIAEEIDAPEDYVKAQAAADKARAEAEKATAKADAAEETAKLAQQAAALNAPGPEAAPGPTPAPSPAPSSN